MPVSFTIRSVTPAHLTVDYADGSWANVPIRKGQSKEEILSIIASFNHRIEPFDTVDAVPFAEGEVGDAPTTQELTDAAVASNANDLMTYADLRAADYPPVGDQLDALYWARQGNPAQLQAIDAEIQSVKSTYPKTMPPITRGEYNSLINAAASE